MAIPDEVKLALYNGALRMLGSRELASVSENREPRRVLDGIWGNGKVITYALTRGEWNFATRTVRVDYTPSVEPDFGFARAFTKPDDIVRVAAMSSDERFTLPMTAREYTDEAGYWFADLDTIYVKYISNGEAYGLDSARWAEPFKNFIEAYMAWQACERLTNNTALRDRLQRDMVQPLKEAKSNDAMDEGVKFLPAGSWSRSRRSRWMR